MSYIKKIINYLLSFIYKKKEKTEQIISNNEDKNSSNIKIITCNVKHVYIKKKNEN